MSEAIGARLRAARQRDSVSQAAVAEVLGVTASQVSRAESGQRHLTGFELGLLANAFAWDVRELLGLERPTDKVALAARLRSHGGSTVDARQRVADIVEVDSILDGLGLKHRSAGLEISEPAGEPRSESHAKEQGQHLAERVRATIGLHGALTDLVGFAEDALGIDVAVAPLGDGCDGVVALGADIALAVVDSTVMSGRQRFTLAHEVGHVVAGDVDHVLVVDDADEGLREERASAFASAFLLPESDLRAVLTGKPDPTDLCDAMVQFGVSWTALKRRLDDLGVSLDPDVGALSGRMVFAAAGRSADVDRLEAPLPVRTPARLVRRVHEAYANGLIGSRLVETALDLHGDALHRELEEVGLRVEVPPPATSSIMD